MGSSSFNVLSLCSGVGALEIGLRLAVPNARTVCYVEREVFACRILAQRMEEGLLDEAPVWSDLQTFTGKRWRGVVDCIIGGFPCQPFSVAGPQRGEKDERYLWPAIARIIREVGPEWCFFENVGNHLCLGFERIEAELRQMGFTVAAGLFTAEEIGAPHQRERVFIMAHANNYRCRYPSLETHNEGWWSSSIWSEDVSNERKGEENKSDPKSGASGIALAFPPHPDDWQGWDRIGSKIEPVVCGMVNGVANRVDRLRAIGNGVVPGVASFAWQTLMVSIQEAEEHPMWGHIKWTGNR